MDPFHFAIALPPEPDSLALLRELSAHVARLIGLNGGAARHAQEELAGIVQSRLKTAPAGTTVDVSFTRNAGEKSVTIEVTSAGRTGEIDSAPPASTRLDEAGRMRQRLAWDVRRDP